MVGKLRNEGMMIYENRTSACVSYRVSTPSKAIINCLDQQSIWEASCLLKLLKLIRLEAVSEVPPLFQFSY